MADPRQRRRYSGPLVIAPPRYLRAGPAPDRPLRGRLRCPARPDAAPGRGGRGQARRPGRRSPTPSAAWSCAARRRSGSPRPTGWRSPPPAAAPAASEVLREDVAPGVLRPGRDAADGREPALGGRAHAECAAAARTATGMRCERRCASAPRRCTPTRSIAAGDRRARRRAPAGRGAGAHPLQRGRARDRRLRHRAGRDPRRASAGNVAARAGWTRRGRSCRARG